MIEKKLYIHTVQNCCNYLYSKTHEPIDYKMLIAYLEKNYDAIILNQRKDFYSNDIIASINNTLVSLNDLTSPMMKMNLEDSTLIPLSKDIFAFKHINNLKNEIHIHNCIEIDFIVKGKAKLYFESKEIKLFSGNVCIISPSSQHNVVVEKDAFVINIFIRNKILKDILNINDQNGDIISQFIYRIIIDKHSSPNYLLFKTEDNPAMKEALKQIIIESHVHQDKYSSIIAISWFKIFIYNVLRNFNSSSLFIPLEDTYKILYEILNYIEDHYKNVSLTKLSQKFHYNEAYLSTLIKKTFDISFVEILTNIKMSYAKSYLINTDMRINDIAYEVGYHSVDHFIRVFAKRNKVTPSKYRKQYQNSEL